MDWTEGRFTDLLPELQAVAARHAGPLSYDHPGQLAWGSVFDGAAPAVIAGGDGYGILESPHWLQVGGSPGRAADVTKWARSRASGFSAMALDGPLASSLARAACHHAAWSDTVPSGMTTGIYERLMDTPYYDTALDWVAVTSGTGEMAASCTAWRCGDVALIEPVGCAPAHRRRGLGGAVTLAALAAAREQGAATGIVRPRGDQGYPVPVRLYRSIGFTDQARTREYRFPGPGGLPVR